MNQRFSIAVILLLSSLFTPHPARAAQSYDNCAGTITALPTTISTQGVWCIKSDLATNITNGNAIEIAANNVTIDCNDFKLGGLAAGKASLVKGIYAFNRQNITVRNCNIRGFYYGIYLYNGAGHLVEDNRLDNNLYMGISMNGENSRVRRNAVYDTGGASGESGAYGIAANGDIIDNTVAGLFADHSGGTLTGIRTYGSTRLVRGNVVSGFDTSATSGGTAGDAIGVDSYSQNIMIVDNGVFGPGSLGTGIYGYGGSNNFCKDNAVASFGTSISSCAAADNNGNNMTSP